MFRLSRVTGRVRRAGRAGSYRVPEGTDLRELARSLQPPPMAGTARLRVRTGAGNALRRRAAAVHAESEEWDRVDVPLAHVDELAEEIVAYGADVVALEPPELADAVVRPAAAAGRHRRGAGDRERPRARPGAADAGPGAVPAGPGRACPSSRSPRDFGVDRQTIVNDLNVLWFCGLPEAVTGDMIDVDMEALETDGVVRLDNADYLRRPLRLTAREALALIVALRTLRETVAPRRGRRRRPGAGQARVRGRRRRGGGRPGGGAQRRAGRRQVRASVQAALHRRRRVHLRLPGAVARRDHRARRRPDAAVHGRGPQLPRGLVPPRRRRPAVPARPGGRRRGARPRGGPAGAGQPARPVGRSVPAR